MATVPPQQQQKASPVRKPTPAPARLRAGREVEGDEELRLPPWRQLAGAGAAADAAPSERKPVVGRAEPEAETLDMGNALGVTSPAAKEPASRMVPPKEAVATEPPAPDIGKEGHDEEQASTAQAARVSGAAEGTAAAASPAQRKEEAAKIAQDAREGRVPTEADRKAEETAEARAEEAEETARKDREEEEALETAREDREDERAMEARAEEQRLAAKKAAGAARPAPPSPLPSPIPKAPVISPPTQATVSAPAAQSKAVGAAPTAAPVKPPPAMRQARGPPHSPERALATAETSAGCPLLASVLESFAQAWGEDFSAVRVHTDRSAARAADLLSAEAFTVGEHVYFAAGRFAPQTPAGAALLAHELAHVVQLRRGDLRGLCGVSAPGSPAEAAADALVVRRGIPSLAPPRDHSPPMSPRPTAREDGSRGQRVRAPAGPRAPPPLDAAPVLRRTTDQAKEFFDQGYFEQANAWGTATAVLDEELGTDAAADTTSFPTPTASLGPEQQPDRPAVAPAAALVLEGEILVPGEAEELAGLGEDASFGEEPDLPTLGHLSTGAEGDTSAARAELDGALDDVPTEFDVATSPGERPPVALDGNADPAQTEDQERAAHDQAEALRAQAASAVEQGPGPEQVQPTSYHEDMPVPPAEAGMLEPLGEIPEMATLQADPIPEEVRAATDAAGQEQLQASLAESDAALDTAAADRDAQREQEIARAEAEQERLDAEATRAQDSEVERARGEIDDHRADTQEQQDAAVADLDTQAADERATVRGDIEARVRSDTQAIEDEYAQAETDAQAEKDAKEAEARSEKAEAERKSEDQSWWESALDAIASFFDALLDAVNAIFDALIEAVGAIIEAAKAAVTAIIDAARDFAVGLVQAFGELLKGLVQDLLGEIFPELAAALAELIDAAVETAVAAINWVADQLKAGLLALLDSIGAAITALLEAYRAAINAAIAIARAALTGDWAALALMVLEAALTLAGIPPESFYAVINNAMSALDTILADPGAFVGNVINAVAAGFQAFADNFLTHLQEGFFAWIVGPLGELGITLPATWDLMGIFGLVMQVLGLTREGIRLVITEELGETAGLIFDFVWRYVDALITGGLEGLWNEIQNDLGMLWDIVVDGIKNWLLETIVVQAVIRIATMFNPVGALINALVTVWNVYQWLRENAQRIFGLVQAVVDMIASIAAGNIQPAALAVEGALASLIPIAISLLANLLGLGGITDKVREVLESVRETVREAIRGLIRRVKGLFTGGEEEPEEPEGQAGDVTGQATMSGASHTLTIDVDGRAVTLASDGGDIGGQTATAFSNLEELEASDPARGQQARQLLQSIQSATAEATAALAAGIPEGQAEAFQARLRELSTQMLSLLREYGDVTGVHALAEPIPVYQPPVLGDHTVAEPGPAPPDGTTRESHHVPANELAQTLRRTFSDEADRLEGEEEEGASQALRAHVPAVLSADGGSLSAILIHSQTHRLGAAAVHASALRPLIDRQLTRIRSGAEAERQQPLDAANAAVAGAAANLTVRIGSGAVAVNPRSGHWQRFVAEAREKAEQIRAEALSRGDADAATVAAETAVVDGALNTAESVCTTSESAAHQQATSGVAEEARVFAQVAFTAALQQASAAVVGALQASVVDGPRDRHPGAADLQARANANGLWRQLVLGA